MKNNETKKKSAFLLEVERVEKMLETTEALLEDMNPKKDRLC